MGERSNIEWTDHTFNPWTGCTKISPGCDRCYAENWSKRTGQVEWGNHPRRRTTVENWRKPLKWAKQAHERPRVFCASLADVFDNQAPEQWRADLFHLIEQTPELDWLLLTKRPENMRKMLPWMGGLIEKPWPNVWLGFTAEDQEHFDRRWPIVRDVPAAVRFCSYEPALGPLKIFGRAGDAGYPPGLHWMICGGESGPGFRYMDLRWAHDLRLDCERAGIAFFMKQLAGKKPFPPEFPVVRQFPESRFT